MTTVTRNFRGAAMIATLCAAALLAGCAPMYSGDTYRRYETMRPQTVEMGVVESARGVQIEGPGTGVGTVGGAVAGGALGNMAGGGSGRIAATLGGAILGGILGNAAEQQANKQNGVEVTVRLDSGRTVAIVQPDMGEGFRPGDRVRMVSNGYATRVTR
jgi:outer membrane lipoprotein SlyB